MAFLDANERKALLDELSKMSYRQAKYKLHRMDRQGRMSLYRNVQNVNQYVTRFDLIGLGTRVTLVETKTDVTDRRGKVMADYQLSEVIVEPTAENRT